MQEENPWRSVPEGRVIRVLSIIPLRAPVQLNSSVSVINFLNDIRTVEFLPLWPSCFLRGLRVPENFWIERINPNNPRPKAVSSVFHLIPLRTSIR